MIPWSDTKNIFRLVIFVLSFFVVGSIILTFYIRKFGLEYPELTIEQKVSGGVINVTRYQSIAMVETNTNLKFALKLSGNYAYKPSNLFEFILEGDIIKKEAGEDTIKIYRNGKEYVFVLGQIIKGYNQK